MQFCFSGLEVNITKRLELTDFKIREVYEHTSVPGETLEVSVALPVQIRAHLLDLKIGHIIYTPA